MTPDKPRWAKQDILEGPGVGMRVQLHGGKLGCSLCCPGAKHFPLTPILVLFALNTGSTTP